MALWIPYRVHYETLKNAVSYLRNFLGISLKHLANNNENSSAKGKEFMRLCVCMHVCVCVCMCIEFPILRRILAHVHSKLWPCLLCLRLDAFATTTGQLCCCCVAFAPKGVAPFVLVRTHIHTYTSKAKIHNCLNAGLAQLFTGSTPGPVIG